MKSLLVRAFATVVAACAVSGASPLAAADGPTYRFSPVNQYGIGLTAAYWNPIIQYVSRKSGVKLELKMGRTSVDTTSYVLAREVDFVFSNHLFSAEREQLGWKVFARRDTAPIRGVIIVPASSPITDVAQLAGKEMVFPGPEATVSYKFTYAHLLARKIDVKPIFAGNTDGALAQLVSGRAAAAGANEQLAEGYARREGSAFRTLWTSSPVHDLALMHSATVPEREARAVAQAFVGMHRDREGREILETVSREVGLAIDTHFVPSDGSEYAVYRDFYRTAPPQLR